MSNKFSLEEVKRIVPKKSRSLVNQETVDVLNAVESDNPDLLGSFKDNYVTYSKVLETPGTSVSDYKDAILFVTRISLGDTDIDAYAKTFPDRYSRLESLGKDRSGISQYANKYKSGKLVSSIIAQTAVPVWITNMGLRQEAINVNADLMYTAKSELVRQKAAETLMKELAQPEENKLTLDINPGKDAIEANNNIAEQLARMADLQVEQFNRGTNLDEVQKLDIEFTEAEVVDE